MTEEGFDLVTTGADTMILLETAKAAVAKTARGSRARQVRAYIASGAGGRWPVQRP